MERYIWATTPYTAICSGRSFVTVVNLTMIVYMGVQVRFWGKKTVDFM